jgi:hypothetical protein
MAKMKKGTEAVGSKLDKWSYKCSD